jgi:hypothetical protein
VLGKGRFALVGRQSRGFRGFGFVHGVCSGNQLRPEMRSSTPAGSSKSE